MIIRIISGEVSSPLPFGGMISPFALLLPFDSDNIQLKENPGMTAMRDCDIGYLLGDL